MGIYDREIEPYDGGDDARIPVYEMVYAMHELAPEKQDRICFLLLIQPFRDIEVYDRNTASQRNTDV